MRPLYFILIILLPLVSCKSKPLSKQDAFIEQLEKLQSALHSQDMKRIEKFLPFPLPSSVALIYFIDDELTKEKEKNGDAVPRAMFFKYFEKIYEQMHMDLLDSALIVLKPQELKKKNKLRYDAKNENFPCYRFYELSFTNDSTAMIMFGTLINYDYGRGADQSTTNTGTQSYCLDYTSVWLFRFDGEKLKLVAKSR